MADTPPQPPATDPANTATAHFGPGAVPASAAGPALVGGRFGDYEVIEEVGRGGMGVVYKARQVSLGRIVALKMILSGTAPADEGRARFQREAEAVAQLNHPHIVQIHEVGTWLSPDGAVPFFSMEFCSGGSLGDFLDGTPLAPARAAALVEVLARAVHAAHATQLIHRDLKPANILLVPDCGEGGAVVLEKEKTEQVPLLDALAQARLAVARRRGVDVTPADDTGRKPPSGRPASSPPGQRWVPKITDFGLARRMNDDSALTATGAVIGTPSYMAPEQARGLKEVGPAADIYALGAILYECLTGRPPFLAASAFETLVQVSDREPVPPQQVNPHVPADVAAVCLRCLEKPPHRRYASAAELADDLQRFREGKPTGARPRGLLGRAYLWCLHPQRVPDAGRVTLFLMLLLTVWAFLVVGCYAAGLFSARHPAALVVPALTGALALALLFTALGTLRRSPVALALGLIGSALGLAGVLGCLADAPLLALLDPTGLYEDADARFPLFALLAVLFGVVVAAHVIAVTAQWANYDPTRQARAAEADEKAAE